jgi:glycosyltransferase involved in cell wall biosynthesis
MMRTALAAATSNVFVSQLEYEGVPKVFRTTGPRFLPLVVDGELHPYRDGRAREPFLLTICWMSGLNPVRKGVDLAIRGHASLVKEYPSLELRIAGSPGDAQAGLEKLVADMGTTGLVKFLGRVDHEEKVRLLQTCEAYLQPSIFEGFGVAAAEAVACGAPVIATRVGTLPEVLGDDAVWMNERSIDSLVAAVRYARGSFTEERRKRAADRIRATFSYGRRRDGIAEAIRDALVERPTRR